MNETLKKFTQEIAEKIATAFASDEIKAIVEKTKAASVEETGTFDVVISTADIDRMGESIEQGGWDLSNYKLNPVVLWAHEYWSLPIGIADAVELTDGKLVAKGRFAPAEANPLAQQVRKLYDMKILQATSVGFIAKEVNGNVITKAELLEFSFVPVPANPYALSLRKAQELGIDRNMLALKGLTLEMKEETTQDPPEPPEPAEPEKKDAMQIGAVMVEMQNEIDESIVNASRRVLEIVSVSYGEGEKTFADRFVKFFEFVKAALPTLTDDEKKRMKEAIETFMAEHPLGAKDSGSGGKEKPAGTEGEEQPDGAAPQRSSVGKGGEDFRDWQTNKHLLRAATTAITQALELANERTQGGRKGK